MFIVGNLELLYVWNSCFGRIITKMSYIKMEMYYNVFIVDIIKIKTIYFAST